MTLQEYKQKVDEESMERYLIGFDEITDNEQAEQAWKDGETVEDFVQAIGTKYDLTDLKVHPWLK